MITLIENDVFGEDCYLSHRGWDDTLEILTNPTDGSYRENCETVFKQVKDFGTLGVTDPMSYMPNVVVTSLRSGMQKEKGVL